MGTDKMRVGIIGVGQIGKKHLETYLSMPNVVVEGIAGRDPVRTEAVANQYQISNWTTDFNELLANPRIQAVSVCVHNNLHKPITIAALQARKHVLCEKPIAGSYTDGVEMIEAAQKSNRILSIQISDLFSDETQAARHAMQQGWVGQPYLAHSSGFRRRGRPFVDGYGTSAFVQKEMAGGGVLFDLGVYHIANILYLLGNPKPLRICGKTYQRTAMDENRQQMSKFDVEEVAVGMVALEGDITLTVNESWAIHLDGWEGSYITGTEGGIRLEPFGLFRSLGDLDINAKVDLAAYRYRKNQLRDIEYAMQGPQQHFIATIQGYSDMIQTAEIALNTMLISEGIYLSQKWNREVTAGEVIQQSASCALPL